MKHMISGLAAFAAMALGIGIASSAQASGAGAYAAGANMAAIVGTQSPNVERVQYQGYHRDDVGGYQNDAWRYYPRHYRDDRWRDKRWRPRRYYRPPPTFYFEFSRPSYRYVQPRVVHPTSSHVRWCHARYKSYRAWDNSWQPYHGPRRQCVSPYRY